MVNVKRVESGTYNRYLTPMQNVIEVFQVTHAEGEPDPLEVTKFYYQPSNSEDPAGPFDTEQQALEAAY